MVSVPSKPLERVWCYLAPSVLQDLMLLSVGLPVPCLERFGCGTSSFNFITKQPKQATNQRDSCKIAVLFFKAPEKRLGHIPANQQASQERDSIHDAVTSERLIVSFRLLKLHLFKRIVVHIWHHVGLRCWIGLVAWPELVKPLERAIFLNHGSNQCDLSHWHPHWKLA